MSSFMDVLHSETRLKKVLYPLLSTSCGTLLLALLSQCAIPLWFTPVPITLQTLGVMLIGAFLGSRRGALCVLLYLFEGAVGLPVFAYGKCGIGILLGPTGGYLIGFVFAAYLIGKLLEKGSEEHNKRTLVALSLGVGMMYGIGTLWLAKFVGPSLAIQLGILPFIGGCIIKIIIAAGLISSGRKWVHSSH